MDSQERILVWSSVTPAEAEQDGGRCLGLLISTLPLFISWRTGSVHTSRTKAATESFAGKGCTHLTQTQQGLPKSSSTSLPCQDTTQERVLPTDGQQRCTGNAVMDPETRRGSDLLAIWATQTAPLQPHGDAPVHLRSIRSHPAQISEGILSPERQRHYGSTGFNSFWKRKLRTEASPQPLPLTLFFAKLPGIKPPLTCLGSKALSQHIASCR